MDSVVCSSRTGQTLDVPRPPTMQPWLPLSLSYLYDQKWQIHLHHLPTTSPGMAPMLPLEPCYAAAHFKGRLSSSIIENICSDWSSRNISAWGSFTILPLGQLQYSTEALHSKLHESENRMYESLCYV